MSERNEFLNEEEKRGRGRPRKHPIELLKTISGEKRGRGRPRKVQNAVVADKDKDTVHVGDTADSGDDHFLQHVKKVFTDKMHHVPFRDGRAHRLSQATAARVLSAHAEIKRSEDKLNFVKHASASLSNMNHVLKHGAPKPVQKDTKRTLPTGDELLKGAKQAIKEGMEVFDDELGDGIVVSINEETKTFDVVYGDRLVEGLTVEDFDFSEVEENEEDERKKLLGESISFYVQKYLKK